MHFELRKEPKIELDLVLTSTPIADLEKSLLTLYRDSMREGSVRLMATSTLDFAARLPIREPHVLKMYLPTQDEIRSRCLAISRKWTPSERARRWRGRPTKRQPE